MKPFIEYLCPDRAQYAPGQEIGIQARVANPSRKRVEARLEIVVMDLATVVDETRETLVLEPGSACSLTIPVPPKTARLRGFGFDARLFVDGEPVSCSSTAFDVADSPRRCPRYGFLSDFTAEAEGEEADADCLRELHLPLAQFYDWMYRHDTLLPPADEFVDPMGSPKSMRTVRSRAAACRARGIRAIAYGAIYAATRPFFQEHPDWGLKDGAGRQCTFIDRFFIMDIAEGSPWRPHIIGQYRDAIKRGGFDGIHMDAYGAPKAGRSRAAGAERVVRLEEEVPSFIRDVRMGLSGTGAEPLLVFNNVGNWPVDASAPAAVDAVYVEAWPPHDTYGDLVDIVRHARAMGGGKPVILAAYCLPFRDAADPDRPAALSSLLLLQAVIAAHGALHLVYGGVQGVLTQGYYPDHTRLTDAEYRAVRAYADFTVRYAALLFDDELRDVSMTHAGGGNREYLFSGAPHSPRPRPGHVWCVIRESRKWKLISFVNLCGLPNDRWNAPKEEPAPARDLTVSMEALGPVEEAFFAAPDINHGRPTSLEGSMEPGSNGLRFVVTVPEVRVWGLLAVRVKE